MKKVVTLALICLTAGCRTLDPSATEVSVADRAGEKCKNLGVVNIDWAWWGVSSESLNVMRNQVVAKGGNLLVPTGDGNMGIAYSCPSDSSSIQTSSANQEKKIIAPSDVKPGDITGDFQKDFKMCDGLENKEAKSCRKLIKRQYDSLEKI